MLVPVIMCGGSGTRLWPMSRHLYPKQLLTVDSERTLLQNTAHRIKGLKSVKKSVVVCNKDHRFMVAEQLYSLGFEDFMIILEPEGKNTAPAIAAASFYSMTLEEDPIILALPADHIIKDIEKFQNTILKGLEAAEKGYLVTFGITPKKPETGYGYIKKGEVILEKGDDKVFRVEKFVEKPDLKTAEEYLKSGDFLWNSGIFMFKASSYLEELKNFAPEIYEKVKEAFDKAKKETDFIYLDEESFRSCPSDSIDYAVMEHTKRAVVVPMDVEWSDVGSWSSIWEILDKDENGNVLMGDVLAYDVKNSYIKSEHRLTAVVGLEDIIVVTTKDVVLVAPKERAQDVKKLVMMLEEQKREEAKTHTVVYRPWGSYETLEKQDRFQVKRIVVKPGAKLSLQRHYHRSEHWVIVKGTGKVTRDNEEFLLSENQYIFLPVTAIHRIENPGKIPLEFIEVQVGSYLEEDDIVRFEDVYGRVDKEKK